VVEPLIIVTNNPMSKEQFGSKYKVIFIEGTMMDILKKSSQKKLYLNIESLTKMINQQDGKKISSEKIQEHEVEQIINMLSLFLSNDSTENNIFKLLEKRNVTYDRIKLIKKVMAYL